MRSITLNNQTYPLISLRTFRAAHNLPDTFGITLFEAKPTEGLAALDQASAELQALRAAVISAVPANVAAGQLFTVIDILQSVFEAELRRINPRVGLDEPEIEFAVAGFVDFCREWGYALIAARHSPPPTFVDVYNRWLNGSTHVSSAEYRYQADVEAWSIHILNSLYGRIGLEVTTPAATHYVSDGAYGCPAEGFMAALMQDVTARFTHALV